MLFHGGLSAKERCVWEVRIGRLLFGSQGVGSKVLLLVCLGRSQ